jgi:cytoskeletal protein RodZ
MKRCPQCLFLYPDSDEVCDFDQTSLEVVDDSALEAATTQKTSPKKSRTLPIVAAAVALVLGVLVVALYFGVSSRSQEASAAPENPTGVQVVTPSPVAPSASPSPASSPSPSPSPTPSPKASPSISTAHTRATGDPVSTSGPGIGTRQGAKPVIMLASGGKIEADEVWRTKDGVWYRRNGVVTLLKRGQVKNISTR